MVVHGCDPGMQEVEAGGVWVSGSLDYTVRQPPLSKTKLNKQQQNNLKVY